MCLGQYTTIHLKVYLVICPQHSKEYWYGTISVTKLDKLGNWEKVHFGFLSHLLEMVPMGWDDTT